MKAFNEAKFEIFMGKDVIVTSEGSTGAGQGGSSGGGGGLD